MDSKSIQSNLYTWPSFKPVWRTSALLFCIVAALFVLLWQLGNALNAMQRQYLAQYAKASLVASIAPSVNIQYRFLDVVRADKFERIALPDELQTLGTTADNSAYFLTTSAKEKGFIDVTMRRGKASAFAVHAALKKFIYPDVDFAHMLYLPLGVCALLCAVGLPFAMACDRRRIALLKQGKRIEGAESISAEEYCKRYPGGSDEESFANRGLEYLCYEQKWRIFGFVKMVRHWITVDRNLEDKHFLYLGDTGNGKSVLLKRNMQQIDEREEAAVIYDPGAQFLEIFLQQSRGDVVLNPLDARFPNWQLLNEVQGPADAHLVAKSLFPSVDKRNKFFEDTSRRIFEHLLLMRPSNEELAQWLSNPREIETRVRGTEMASMIDSKAGEQRAGVLSSLGLVADALRLLPPPVPNQPAWSTAKWAKNRAGWVFITSTHIDRDKLRPLMTLWMDLLIARSMTDLEASKRRAWFLFDEAASLGYMPSLPVLLAESRKANCSVVLATQSHTDLKVYGDKAEAMLSQPKTKIILGVSGVESSKWASQQLGNVKLVRYRESRSLPQGVDRRQSTSYQQEIGVEPLVMDSVIAGLPALSGYLKCGNEVVPMQISYCHYQKSAPSFIARTESEQDETDSINNHGTEPEFFE